MTLVEEEWILESVVSEPRGFRGREVAVRSDREASEESSSGEEFRDLDSVRSTWHVDSSAVRFGDMVSAQRAERLRARLDEAATAYAGDRYGDAAAILRTIAEEAPGVAEVRELLGLAYYRQRRWKDAARELRAFNEITGSTEQHPVLADCARALGRHGQVEAYWKALRSAALDADLLAEGRIVMAGSLADQDRLDDAIRLIEAGREQVEGTAERDLRMAYVLADLQERAGDLPTARSGFEWLQVQDPEFADVGERLSALS